MIRIIKCKDEIKNKCKYCSCLYYYTKLDIKYRISDDIKIGIYCPYCNLINKEPLWKKIYNILFK